MAIVQEATTELIIIDLATDLMYNKATHQLVPTLDLIKNNNGRDLVTLLNSKTNADVALNNCSNLVYGFLWANMPKENKLKVLALIAEDANGEQLTMAKAFIAMFNYAFKGGDELASEIGIDFVTGIVIPITDIRSRVVSEEVKQILSAGEVWKRATLTYEVSDITDLTYGTDY